MDNNRTLDTAGWLRGRGAGLREAAGMARRAGATDLADRLAAQAAQRDETAAAFNQRRGLDADRGLPDLSGR